MSDPDPPPDTPVPGRIADALARLGTLARAREQLASSNELLSPLQARALGLLRRRGDLRVGAIAKELMVSYGTISVALTTLEEKGLVTKTRDPAEHRAVQVELTRRGRALADRASGATADVLAPAVAALPPKESAALLASLLKLILALERSGAIGHARMCPSCVHFVPDGGNRRRRHYCRLLQTAIGDADLRVDCPEHERAGAEQVAAAARAFHPLA